MDFFVTARDGVRLAVGAHVASGRAPAVLVLLGIASHMGWYRGFAREMARAGISAFLVDRRGSGRSEGPRGHVGSWKTLADDVASVGEDVRGRCDASSFHLMGISLGSVVALASVLRRPDPWRSVILLSPGLATFYRAPLLRRLALVRRSLLSPLSLFDLPFSVEQLTDQISWRSALTGDPLRTSRLTARFVVETFRMQSFVRSRIRRIRMPVACFLGETDEIVDNAAVVRALSRVGADRVHVETFEGASHILPASVPDREMIARLATWVAEATGPGGLGRTSIRTPRFQGEGHALPGPPEFEDARGI